MIAKRKVRVIFMNLEDNQDPSNITDYSKLCSYSGDLRRGFAAVVTVYLRISG